jgi:hypothetical protein
MTALRSKDLLAHFAPGARAAAARWTVGGDAEACACQGRCGAEGEGREMARG